MRYQYPSLARALLFTTALVLLHGCTGGVTSEVRGKVTYNGTPIEKGQISFYPVDGTGKPEGGDIKDGTYSVRMAPGKMQVRISMPGKAHQRKLYNTPDSPVATRYDEGLPEKYSGLKSELKLDVTPGVVDKDWTLMSK